MTDSIQKLAHQIQDRLSPELTGKDMSLVIPAMIQVTLNMTMFGVGCSPREAADLIIKALEEAKSAGKN